SARRLRAGAGNRPALYSLYIILYTSGTTGIPKGVVRDNGGHAVALHWSLRNIYGVKPDEVFWTASDVGWVVGHSYIVVYAPPAAPCWVGRSAGWMRKRRAGRASSRRARWARWWSNCFCRRGHCRPSGKPTTSSPLLI